MGMPFTPTFPTSNQDPWFTTMDGGLTAVRDRIRQHEAVLGVPLDSFAGVSDDAKLAAAITYVKTQTYAPPILLANRVHTFNGSYDLFNGMRLVGSALTMEREFSTTGPQCIVTVTGAALFNVPASGVKNVWMSGIQFRAGAGTVNWLSPVSDLSAGPIMNDCVFERLAWVGFASIMQARHLRVHIERVYINGGTDNQLKLAGSDNYYFTEGKSYMSSTALAATKFYLWFTHMSRSRVGGIYITPERATAVRIDGSYGDLQFDGTLLDSTGRDLTKACQGAAILITGGRGMVFKNLWFFNNCVAPSSTGRSPQDKGQVYIRGSAADLLFMGCSWAGGEAQTVVTPAGTPAIYAATGVSNVKVVAPIGPAAGEKSLQHQSSGIITKFAADDWALTVA